MKAIKGIVRGTIVGKSIDTGSNDMYHTAGSPNRMISCKPQLGNPFSRRESLSIWSGVRLFQVK